MKLNQHLIVLAVLMLFCISSSAQELEGPKFGTFLSKKEAEPERDAIWEETNFFTPKKALEIPRITPENYRKPVDMAGIVSGMERARQSSRNQVSLENIRLSYASYQKEVKKPSFQINGGLESNLNSKLPNGTCVHGYIERYCNFCSPRNTFGNFGRQGMYNAPLNQMRRRHYFYP